MFLGRQAMQEQYMGFIGRVGVKSGWERERRVGAPGLQGRICVLAFALTFNLITPRRVLSWVNGLWFHCSRLSPPSKPTNRVLPGMDFTLFPFVNGLDGDEFNPKAFE